MQNEIDRMLEDARRVLTEPVPNISELFPDDLLADSVAYQTVADNLASRFAAADEMIRELEAIAEDEVWEELGMRSDNGSQTRSGSRRAPASHRFHQRLLTSTYDRGGGDGSLLTPPLSRCDCPQHFYPSHRKAKKKN
ncbi:hypothetical protein L210DRAFT_3515069, partial [Boletus edulis BED1]